MTGWRRARFSYPAVLAVSAVLSWGCMTEPEPPSREQIPLLRQQLFRLQEAVRLRNGAAIDSLLSVEILNEGLSRDSLLRFVYGAADTIPFVRIANYQIVFDNNRARIDCELVDSASQNRPIVLTWLLADSTWLLKRFAPAAPAETATP